MPNWTYFILFNRALQGMLEIGPGIYDGYAHTRCAARQRRSASGLCDWFSPSSCIQEPLFNPTNSYSSYVVPAAFVLILHQTLLMGAAMLGGAAFEQSGGGARECVRHLLRSSAKVWRVGRSTCRHAALFRHYAEDLRVLGARQHLGAGCPLYPVHPGDELLGQALGQLFRHRETAVLLVLASSLPQFFLVGVSWPAEALPGGAAAVCATYCRA